MIEPHPAEAVPNTASFSLRALLFKEWPYLAMLVLALFGVAYTSVAQRPITLYWMSLTPFIGLICVMSRWRHTETGASRSRLLWTQGLHWSAVLVAMNLMFITDVARMMNTDASALVILTVLALGVFTAGIHVASWRICLVGIVLAVGVPAIAWLEQWTLLLFLGAVVLVAIGALYWSYEGRERRTA